jgi:hypothetical protein
VVFSRLKILVAHRPGHYALVATATPEEMARAKAIVAELDAKADRVAMENEDRRAARRASSRPWLATRCGRLTLGSR